MAVQMMSAANLALQERINSDTAKTGHEQFDKDGYIIIKNVWDPEELYHPVPQEKGQFHYGNSVYEYRHDAVEQQVEGSLARYNHPMYRRIHSGIRKKIEKCLGKKLYNTYYYDRYYFAGQELSKHADRDACEISISIHISTNLEGEDADWPFYIKTPDTYYDESKRDILAPGSVKSAILKPGDGVIYKGCERPHWREPMPGAPVGKRLKFFKKQTKEYYYHQIFFHYVLQDGYRAHCAFESKRQ